jgi:argininosuccinate synthase
VRILLAYSGDLATTAAIPWLREQHQAEVITATIDLGQGRELEAVRDRALAAGALRAHVLDSRDQFARDFILPSLKADAIDDKSVMAIALGRPLIARRLVELAEMERADAVAYGGAARGDIPAVLPMLLAALKPALPLIAVPSGSPDDLAAYASAHGVTVVPDEHVEANLWGRTVWLAHAATGHEYAWTREPSACPNEAAEVTITFDRGIPVTINGVFMPLLELIASLGTIAGAHGVGRGAAATRLSSEAPAAIVLHAAHRQLQARAITGDLEAFTRDVTRKYVELIAGGQWFSPLREALDAFVDKVQERVTGGVRLTLFKGNVDTH